MKKLILSIVLVFIAWSGMDFLIHGILLQPTYEATASLWRPEDEMKMGLMQLVTFLSAAFFVAIYAKLIKEKSITTGLKYGVLYGLAVGIPMGYGSYSYMPMPVSLAYSWLLAMLAEAVVGGLILGALKTECPSCCSKESCCKETEGSCE